MEVIGTGAAGVAEGLDIAGHSWGKELVGTAADDAEVAEGRAAGTEEGTGDAEGQASRSEQADASPAGLAVGDHTEIGEVSTMQAGQRKAEGRQEGRPGEHLGKNLDMRVVVVGLFRTLEAEVAVQVADQAGGGKAKGIPPVAAERYSWLKTQSLMSK